ncbi:MAG: hypothetical protein AB7V18_03280 [Pyrinomonadaceae bacterium]
MTAEKASAKRPAMRILLWVVFFASSAIFLIAAGFFLIDLFPKAAGPPQGTQGDAGASLTTVVTAVASLVTSLATLAGIAMGWKKQSIETARAQIEIERLRLDLENARAPSSQDRPSK